MIYLSNLNDKFNGNTSENDKNISLMVFHQFSQFTIVFDQYYNLTMKLHHFMRIVLYQYNQTMECCPYITYGIVFIIVGFDVLNLIVFINWNWFCLSQFYVYCYNSFSINNHINYYNSCSSIENRDWI